MTRWQSAPTTYFNGEGRAFMQECLGAAFKSAVEREAKTIVIFTGSGEGPLFALQHLLPKVEYSHINIVAVTPPFGRPYKRLPSEELVTAGIADQLRRFLTSSGIPVISAHLPFKGIQIGHDRASDWSRVAEAFGVMGGGFALCVQSILIAADAGYIEVGERVIATTADTAIIALAARTETFISPTEGLIVEHVITRPSVFDISKPRHRQWFTPPPPPPTPAQAPPNAPANTTLLPTPTASPSTTASQGLTNRQSSKKAKKVKTDT